MSKDRSWCACFSQEAAIDSFHATAYAMNQIRIMLTGHEREVGGVLPRERERRWVQAFLGKCF